MIFVILRFSKLSTTCLPVHQTRWSYRKEGRCQEGRGGSHFIVKASSGFVHEIGSIFASFYSISLWKRKLALSWSHDTEHSSGILTSPSALGPLQLWPLYKPSTPDTQPFYHLRQLASLHPALTLNLTSLWLALSSLLKLLYPKLKTF